MFCEVKAKSSRELGDPAEMVNAEKQRRIRLAAEAWLASQREVEGCEARFDVAAERAGQADRRLRRLLAPAADDELDLEASRLARARARCLADDLADPSRARVANPADPAVPGADPALRAPERHPDHARHDAANRRRGWWRRRRLDRRRRRWRRRRPRRRRADRPVEDRDDGLTVDHRPAALARQVQEERLARARAGRRR